MKSLLQKVAAVVTFAVLAVAGGRADAQEILYLDPHTPTARVGAGQFLLSPADTTIVGQDRLFLGEVQDRGAAGTASGPQTQVGATIGGNPVFDAGTLPGIFPRNLTVDIGFEYLRPVFPGHSVTLAVPSGVNGNFATLAGSGDVSFDFGFIPKLSMDYQFQDLGFGVAASGELMSLSGHLTRSIDSAGGSANLTANSIVNLAIANLIEGSAQFTLDRFPCFEDTCLEDTFVRLTLGTRYSHLSQDYTANLSSGGSGSTLTAHQDWDGFGLTGSISFLYPLPRDFFFYGVSRGSFLLGNNNRNSTETVVVTGNGAASTSTKLTDNTTDVVPVGEFEFGVAWGKPLAPTKAAERSVTKAGPLLWVKAGFVADIWGNLGILSAPDSIHGFSDSRLFLYGFTVMAGVKF